MIWIRAEWLKASPRSLAADVFLLQPGTRPCSYDDDQFAGKKQGGSKTPLVLVTCVTHSCTLTNREKEGFFSLSRSYDAWVQPLCAWARLLVARWEDHCSVKVLSCFLAEWSVPLCEGKCRWMRQGVPEPAFDVASSGVCAGPDAVIVALIPAPNRRRKRTRASICAGPTREEVTSVDPHLTSKTARLPPHSINIW